MGAALKRPLPRLAVLSCALFVMAGCSGSRPEPVQESIPPMTVPTTSGSPSSAGTATASSIPKAKIAEPPSGTSVIEVFVAGTRVAPKPAKHTVTPGQKVRLLVTTDKANVVHVHGADIERDVKPGVPVIVDFSITQPGVYPIELHNPELLLAQVVVR